VNKYTWNVVGAYVTALIQNNDVKQKLSFNSFLTANLVLTPFSHWRHFLLTVDMLWRLGGSIECRLASSDLLLSDASFPLAVWSCIDTKYSDLFLLSSKIDTQIKWSLLLIWLFRLSHSFIFLWLHSLSLFDFGVLFDYPNWGFSVFFPRF
jgi:hypothetical protein